MRYGEATLEEVAVAMAQMGFTQRFEDVGHRGNTCFVVTDRVPTNEFIKDHGSDRFLVTACIDGDWDKHMKVRMASEPATVNRFFIIGKGEQSFQAAMEEMMARAAQA